MPRSSLPSVVNAWFERLRPVSSRGVRAWVNTSWDLLQGGSLPGDWSAEEVERVITLVRPSRADLEEIVEDRMFEMEDESAFDESSYVWRDFVTGARPIVAPGLVEPAELFSVTMATDGFCISSVWSWTALALTDDLALLVARSDDWGIWTLPHPLGVITRDDIYRSATLLLLNAEQQDYDRFGRGTDFFDQLRTEGIRDVEAYRILLAASRHGGRRILDLSPSALPAFRTTRMARAFESVVELLDATRTQSC